MTKTMQKSSLYLISLVLSTLALSACSNKTLMIKDAYVPVRSESQMHYAAYFEISNKTEVTTILSSVSSPQFKNVMLHTSIVENGMAKMRHLEEVPIASGEIVKFEPNGKHVMLMKPNEAIWSRDNIELQFTFSDGSQLTQLASIRKTQ